MEPIFLVLPEFGFLLLDLSTSWSTIVVLRTSNTDQVVKNPMEEIQILVRQEERIPLSWYLFNALASHFSSKLSQLHLKIDIQYNYSFEFQAKMRAHIWSF